MEAAHDNYRARLDKSREAERLASKHIARMMPKHRYELAYGILAELLDDGISYADFQSAQAAERYIRKAVNALKGLS